MRKQFYRHLYLELLEDRDLTNMPFGQLGTPVLGLPSLDNAGLDGSWLVALNAITRSVADGQANSAPFTHATAGQGSLTAISGTGHHCCSHAYIDESPLPGSPTIANGNGNQGTAHANQEFQSRGDFASLSAAFDSFVDNSFDSDFPSPKNATPVLPGGGDGGMSSHAGVGSASGSSSGMGRQSGGFLASTPGSVTLASAPASGPMMLFPSGHNSSPVVAATPKPSPSSSSISPALASGPLALRCADPICLTAQPYVPVNADNDNGSAVTNGIPAQRDFSVNPLNTNDPELLKATLGTNMLPPGGTWTVTTPNTPSSALGRIALWTDQKKTARFLPSGSGTFTVNFYIEGVHESSALNDLTLTFTYVTTTPPNQYSASASITVTPLIGSFTVTPLGGSTGQNINFYDQYPAVDGLNGLVAGFPGTPSRQQQPGATFQGDVTRTNLNGNVGFIQNLTAVTNGYNRGVAGWVYTATSGLTNENLVPRPPLLPNFPFLDCIPGNANPGCPFYNLNFNYTTNTADRQVPVDTDSPATAAAANAGFTEDIDLLEKFTLYLVWQYNSGILYPIANILWQVNFLADTNIPNVGVTNIVIPHGLTAGTFTRSNAVPGALAPPVAYGNFTWA